MTLPIVYRVEVPDEINEAEEWYDEQRPGLGRQFRATLTGHLDTIVAAPLAYAVEYREVRSAPMQRFPYVVYYRVESDRIVVIAVLHGRRDPRTWQRRVR